MCGGVAGALLAVNLFGSRLTKWAVRSGVTFVRLGVSAVLALLGAGLGSTVAAQDLPRFLQELIARKEASPSRSFDKIWRYQYNGETVYYIPASPLFSDSSSQLYDSAGELICKPDGGYTGRGDGRCPDFLEARSKGQLVWRDSRFETSQPESRGAEDDRSPSGVPPDA